MKGKKAVNILLAAVMATGCGVIFSRKQVQDDVRVSISETVSSERELSVGEREKRIFRDTASGGEDLVLNAVVEETGGEIVGQGKIAPITVEARHKNIAERNGIVKLSFDVHVPSSILSEDQQVRIVPHLFTEDTSKLLDRIFVTGGKYRRAQEKGYERFKKYFASIIPDSVDFLKAFGYLGLLKLFVERNVEDRETGEFGVTEPEAVDYYIKHYLVRANRRRKDRLEEVYRKCVKDPADKLGVRLDTVLENPSGGLVYRYVQELKAAEGMHRLRLAFGGSVHTYGKKLYGFSSPDTLTYYVSSIVQLADTTEMYREQTLARDVSVSTLAYIEFEKGSWEIDTTLGNNAFELNRIKVDIDSLKSSKTFAADSMLVEASCSPEGSYAFNRNLSRKRAESIVEYFNGAYGPSNDIRFSFSYIPENWDLLKEHILGDSLVRDKGQTLAVFGEEDPDKREELLAGCTDYPYIRSHIYPMLRRILFNFHLHRRIYDTIRSKVEIDEMYKRGLKALQARDFKKATEILGPYSDQNTAIAYLCLDYNASALKILTGLERTPQVSYLIAIAYSRLGKNAQAEDCFAQAIKENPRLKFRAALDPEMSPFLEKAE